MVGMYGQEFIGQSPRGPLAIPFYPRAELFSGENVLGGCSDAELYRMVGGVNDADDSDRLVKVEDDLVTLL